MTLSPSLTVPYRHREYIYGHAAQWSVEWGRDISDVLLVHLPGSAVGRMALYFTSNKAVYTIISSTARGRDPSDYFTCTRTRSRHTASHRQAGIWFGREKAVTRRRLVRRAYVRTSHWHC